MPDDDLLTGLVAESPAPKRRVRPTQSPVPAPTGLDPQFQTQVDEIIGSLKSRGLSARVAEGYRSPQKQEDDYAQGRTKPGPIVTYARANIGKHPRGLAADIDLIDNTGKPLSSNDPSWRTLGEEAQRRGLGWGGNWKKLRDLRHVESRRGGQAQAVTAPAQPKDDLTTGIVGDDDLLSGVVKDPIDSALTSTVQNLQQKSAEAKRRQAMQAKVEQARGRLAIGGAPGISTGRPRQPIAPNPNRPYDIIPTVLNAPENPQRQQLVEANYQKLKHNQSMREMQYPGAERANIAHTLKSDEELRTQAQDLASERMRMEARRPEIDAIKKKLVDFAGKDSHGARLKESVFGALADSGVQAGNLLSSLTGGARGGNVTDKMRLAQQAIAELDQEDPNKGWVATAEKVLPGAGFEAAKMVALSAIPGAGRLTLPGLGAMSEADKGLMPAAIGAAQGEMYHRGFGAMEGMSRPAKFVAGTSVPAAVGIARGEDPKKAILSNTAFGTMAALGGGAPARDVGNDLAVRDGAVNVSPDVPVRGLPAEGVAAVPPAVEQAERRQVRREFDKIKESASKTAEVPVTPAPSPPEAAQPALQTETTAPSLERGTPGTKHPETGRKFSSTQVDLPAEASKLQQKAASEIPDSELAADGREKDAHITVKYGLHTENAEEVRALLANEPPIKAKIGKVSVFPAKEGADYDVVKMDVDSPDLHRLNAKIAENLKVTDTHPEYKPHVTLGYVKPGMGEKYAGRANSLTGQEITLDKLLFSGRGGQEVEIPLKGSAREEVIQQPSKPAEKGEPQNVEKAVVPALEAQLPSNTSKGEAEVAPNKPITASAEPSVELARTRKEAFEANRAAFDLPLIKTEKANLKMKVDVTYESESGRSVTKKVAVEKFQKELERKQSVLNKLLDCVHA